VIESICVRALRLIKLTGIINMNSKETSMDRIFLDVWTSIPMKVYEVLSSVWGIVLSGLVFCGTFLGDRLPILGYIAVAVIIDCFWGVATAIRTEKFIFSRFIAKSAIKILAYVSIYGLVALLEKVFVNSEFTITSSIFASILISSELWSILGHIAIAYPDLLVVKLLRKHLKGEMSKKLDISEEELDEILTKKTEEKKAKKTEEKKAKEKEKISQ